MSAFGAAFVVARLLFGGLPDRFGGARVAVASAAVAAAGQFGMWLATSSAMAVAAAALTGLGFSLAFPSFGVEAIRRVPPQNRGVALGAYARPSRWAGSRRSRRSASRSRWDPEPDRDPTGSRPRA